MKSLIPVWREHSRSCFHFT